MFSFIKNHLQKIYSKVTAKLHSLFSRSSVDEQTLRELEYLLLQSDTGAKTTHAILATLKKQYASGSLHDGASLHDALNTCLLETLSRTKPLVHNPTVYLLVGINGSGKTTFASKLAQFNVSMGKKVLLVAADTFRAAAVEQLATWAERTKSTLVTGTANQDPASVVFKACEQFKQGAYDTLIIDTAGRLQTKTNLMKELEKIKKTIGRVLPHATVCTLLTIDAMLGQNSLDQAKLFHEATQLDGIVLTKMDGTGKGGIIFAIAQELSLPVAFISFGENLEAMSPFDPTSYVRDLLSSS